MSEEIVEVSAEEIERRKINAEELFYKYFLYFATDVGFYIFDSRIDVPCDKNRINLIDRYLSIVIEYLCSPENYFQKNSFEDFIQSIVNDAGTQMFVLPTLPNEKIPIQANLLSYRNAPLKNFLGQLIEIYDDMPDFQKQKVSIYKKKALEIYDLYVNIHKQFDNNSSLYLEILERYPNATVEQILTACLLFKHSPWYNKWSVRSVLSYYSEEDLDVIKEIYDYFSPINNPDDEKNFFRYFYDNRKILSHKTKKLKFDLIANFIKSDWKPSKLLNQFTKDEQNLIMTWLKDPDFAEIATTKLVIRNFLITHKVNEINPVEFIRNLKRDYSANHNNTELPNSDIRTVLNFDIGNLFSTEPMKNFIPFEYDQLPSGIKEIFIAEHISIVSSNLSSVNNDMPTNFLSKNPGFVPNMFWCSCNYLQPYIENVDPNLQLELINIICQKYDTIFNNIFEIDNEISMDTIMPFVQKFFGFEKDQTNNLIAIYNPNHDNDNQIKLKSINTGDKFPLEIFAFLAIAFKSLQLKNASFFKCSILGAINVLQNPERIMQLRSRNVSEAFAAQLAKCIEANHDYLPKLTEILSYINLNDELAQAILNNEKIKNMCPELKEKAITEKRSFIPGDFKQNLSADFISYLPKETFKEETLTQLLTLNELIDKLSPKVIKRAVSKPELCVIIKNIAKATSYGDISQETKDYITQNKNFGDPIVKFFAQKHLKLITPEILTDLNSPPLNKDIIYLYLNNQNITDDDTKKVRVALLNNRNVRCYHFKSTQLQNEAKIEIEIRNILQDIVNISKQENSQQMLYTLANSMKLNAMNEKDRGVPDDKNESLYIFNQVLERLPFVLLAKPIFAEVATQKYENSFREKLNNAQIVSAAQSVLQQTPKQDQFQQL